MSSRSFAIALRAARRALLRMAETAGPELERRITDEGEAAVWMEEASDGADLWITGDGLDPETVRRLVRETFSISGPGDEA